MNYYNEFDKNAAEWIRQLIEMGEIPKGEVDERSIEDVTAGDLRGYTQCHFFCGIAGWPEALRRAGVPATRPLWTGSCPCQDYSCAGKGKGMEGKRDLWPEFFRLIRECRPERVFGEQVEDAIGYGWLDRLSADMETEGYAVGSVVLGAHSAGADHIRQRLYWVADLQGERFGETRMCIGQSTKRTCIGRESCGMVNSEVPERGIGGEDEQWRGSAQTGGSRGVAVRMGDAASGEDHRRGLGIMEQAQSGRGCGDDASGATGSNGGVVNPTFIGPEVREHVYGEMQRGRPDKGRELGGMVDSICQRGCCGKSGGEDAIDAGKSGQACNFWSRAVAFPCRDNCFRRFEPGVFPLVAKLPRGVVPSGDPRVPGYANSTGEARVMRLKGYGNAICVETAKLFIECAMETIEKEG